MKQIFILLFLFSFFQTQAQIKFEKAYFIDLDGNRNECLIKNKEWKYNPIEFEYKLSEDGEIKTGDLQNISEFGIYQSAKFVRATVEIDRSGDSVNDLTENPQPVFEQQTLFLKVLFEGEVNLYSFVDGNLYRYFYKTEESDIQQLVYKRFIVRNKNGEQKISKNEKFKSQLRSALKSESMSSERFANLEYNSNSLTKLFKDYNQSKGSTSVDYSNKTKTAFHLSVRPRMNSTSLKTINHSIDRTTELGSSTSFGLGLELEFVFPFNKGKWAAAVEPSFHQYKSDVTIERSNISGGLLEIHSQYSAVQLGVGGRHYMFLSPESKLFLGLALLMDFEIGDNFIEARRKNGSQYQRIEIYESGITTNVGFSVGYKFKNRYSLELRGETRRNLIYSGDVHYKNFSVIFGYTIF